MVKNASTKYCNMTRDNDDFNMPAKESFTPIPTWHLTDFYVTYEVQKWVRACLQPIVPWKSISSGAVNQLNEGHPSQVSALRWPVSDGREGIDSIEAF